MISNITKAHLNYGSIIGLILYGLFNLYLYTFDINPLGNIKWLSVIVQYTILFIFLKKIKLEFLKDTPTFKFIFRSAMLIVLYYATLFGGLVYLHGIFLDSLA